MVCDTAFITVREYVPLARGLVLGAAGGGLVKRLVEFPVEAGGVVVIEVDEPGPESGFEQAARPGEVVERAQQSIETALDRIRPAAEAIVAKLLELPRRPDEITCTFGIKLGAKVGAYVAFANAEANYSVALTWKSERQGAAG
jgi:hypothetical protein